MPERVVNLGKGGYNPPPVNLDKNLKEAGGEVIRGHSKGKAKRKQSRGAKWRGIWVVLTKTASGICRHKKFIRGNLGKAKLLNP